MKIIVKIALFTFASLNMYSIYSQDSTFNKDLKISQLKLALLESQVVNLETNIHFLSSIPNTYNQDLQNLEDRLTGLNSQIEKITKKLLIFPDSLLFIPYDQAIKVNFLRLMESTLEISFEKSLSKNWSIDISPLLTYATESGFSGYYIKNQDFEVYDIGSNSYYSFDGDMLTGLGIIVQSRKYLLSQFNTRYNAPIGLYAGPQLMYRKVWITGKSSVYRNDDYVLQEITQKLDIISGGVFLGGKFVLLKVISVDVFTGGIMRLSYYENEKGLTKYKRWRNIDYTGVLPILGIHIGVLK